MTLGTQKYDRWLERIGSARQIQRRHRDDWSRFRNLYLWGTNRQTIQAHRTLNIDSVRLNLGFAYTRQLLPRVFFKAPRVFAEPKRPGDDQAAIASGLALNYIHEEIDAWTQYRMAVLDALIFGIGIVKFGFDSEFGIDPADVVDRIDARVEINSMREQLTQVRTMAGLGPGKLPPKTKPFHGGDPLLEYHQNVIREFPWALRVSPYDFLVDPEATSLENAKWVAHRIRRPVDDIKEDKRYRGNRTKLKGENMTAANETVWDESGDPQDPEKREMGAIGGELVRSIARQAPLGTDSAPKLEPYGTIYEVWDRKTDTVITICPELSEELRYEPNPFEMEGFPFEIIGFNEVPDRFYPKSDFADIEPQILELNQIRQMSLQWFRRKAKFITAMPENTLSEEQMEMLTGPDPFVVLEIQGQTTDQIKELDLGDFNPAIYEIEERLKRDIRDAIGLSEEQLGSAVAGVTATASANVEASANIRIADKQLKVEVFCRNCARKLLQIIRQFFPPEVMVPVVGARGTNWMPLTAEEIRREYDVRIEAGSTTKPNDEVKRRQWTEIIQALGPLQQTGVINVNWLELLRQTLYAYGVSDPELILQGQMPPVLPPEMLMGGGMQPGVGGQSPEATGSMSAPGMGVPVGGPEAGNGAESMGGRFSDAIMNALSQQRVGT